MIGRLEGSLIEKQPPWLVIDVQGIGYEVQAPMTTFYRLPELGSRVMLYTHFAVSESAQQLFGFSEKRDRQLFRSLIKVNGVGPKMALGILSGMEADDFVRCVLEENAMALVKVPGVGKKTAERLVIEMRDRVKDWESLSVHGDVTNPDLKPAAQIEQSSTQMIQSIASEAESALVALGYKPQDAVKMIRAAQKQQTVTRSEDLIRLALRSLVAG